ncbi:MAG: hypothetical protein AB7F88_11115 [Pyrinomonadaceae bacterium]
MLKKNLVLIAIITLGLVAASDAFGQDRGTRPSQKSKKNLNGNALPEVGDEVLVTQPAVKSKKPRAAQKTKKQTRQRTSTGKTSTTSKIKPKQPVSFTSAEGRSMSFELYRQNKTNGRKSKPVKRTNLGDTGTHEVGHKQRKRRRN